MAFDCDFVAECRECGEYLIATSKEFVVCPRGHGRLIPRCRRCHAKMRAHQKRKWRMALPAAQKTDVRIGRRPTYVIHGRPGLFVIGRGISVAHLEIADVAILRGYARKFFPVKEVQ